MTIDFSLLPKEKSFGLLFSIVSLLALAWGLWADWSQIALMLLGGLAIAFFVIGYTIPILLRPLNILWFLFGVVMNFIVGTIFLTVIFYCLFTPAGLLIRLSGRDALRLESEGQKSHWVAPEIKADYTQSFHHQF